MVIRYDPPVPAAGVPLSVAVPFPLSVKVTPLGSAPVSARDGIGVPVAVTVNVPRVPTVNVVLLALVITGAVFTVSMKLWLTGEPTPLVAVNVMVDVPLVPDAGVPLSVPVPFPLSVKVTPLGSVPDSLSVGLGNPVVVTVKLPGAPTVKVALFALVMAGAWSTVSVKLCTAFGTAPFAAVIMMGYVPPVPAAGVPLSRPLVELRVTPVGSGPVSLNVGAGKPVAVTLNDPAVPTVNVVLFALVIVGGRSTDSVKFCTPSAPIPLCAVNISG